MTLESRSSYIPLQLRRLLITWTAELHVVAGAALLAFWLRFEFVIPAAHLPHLWYALGAWLLTKPAIFHACGLTHRWWRHSSIPDLLRLGFANIAASITGAAVITALAPPGFPRSIYLLDLILTSLLTAGFAAAARIWFESRTRSMPSSSQTAIIYGAGAGGVMLLREIQSNRTLGYTIAGFVDDDPSLRGMLIRGVPVLGSGVDLARLVSSHSVTYVLIALPSASGEQMTRVLSHCHASGVRFKTLPGMAEVLHERGRLVNLRDVKVEDLLGRKPVQLDKSRIDSKLHGKVVLVTGAAGSIGSELCRQIAAAKPSALIAVDNAETAMFHLERELRGSFPDLNLVPEIGNVQNRDRLREIFSAYEPVMVYHAAAYKHVPMMEANVFEAIENNIFGALNVAEISAEAGVRDFVMISSDKAVRPTNIMGATKRVAELVIRSLQNTGTRYVSVRFGNVLGSNGSVVPIFRKQIEDGGPVTVTHPEMRRFFMTIPEAVQLVLQAAAMGAGGEIFVLDMGTPVKIVDLANQLILLSGYTPGEDIRIEFTGARPGEKLYEELNLDEESTLPTSHPKIKVFSGTTLAEPEMAAHLMRLRSASSKRDVAALLTALKDIVPDYNPSKALLARALESDLLRMSNAVGRASAWQEKSAAGCDELSDSKELNVQPA